MEWEEYQAKLQQINNPDTDAETRAMLYTEMTEDYSSKIATGFKKQRRDIKKIKKDNSKLS